MAMTLTMTDMPWGSLKASLRSGLKKARLQEKRGGAGVLVFSQRQAPFCVVELRDPPKTTKTANANANANTNTDATGSQYDTARCVKVSVTGLTDEDLATLLALDLGASLQQSTPGTSCTSLFRWSDSQQSMSGGHPIQCCGRRLLTMQQRKQASYLGSHCY